MTEPVGRFLIRLGVSAAGQHPHFAYKQPRYHALPAPTTIRRMAVARRLNATLRSYPHKQRSFRKSRDLIFGLTICIRQLIRKREAGNSTSASVRVWQRMRSCVELARAAKTLVTRCHQRCIGSASTHRLGGPNSIQNTDERHKPCQHNCYFLCYPTE